jgi:nicotinamidase/pyrazinamidase
VKSLESSSLHQDRKATRSDQNPQRALIVVDVQNDFCEGGSLVVAGGTEVARQISSALNADAGHWDHVVATRDYHIDPGDHFSEQPDYRDSWPPHCIAGTTGAQLHPELARERVAAIFDKGTYSAAYSGFEGIAGDVPLRDWLRAHHVDYLDIVGIATDHCVRATALDAVRYGFAVTVLLEMTAAVAAETTKHALMQMRDVGVQLIGAPIA